MYNFLVRFKSFYIIHSFTLRTFVLFSTARNQCQLANTEKEDEKEKRTQHSRWCLVRSLEGTAFAGGLRSGQLFMAGCIRGGYKRRLLQTLNSPYINQTPARCAAPQESEEGDVAPHFFPTHLARSASSSTRLQRRVRCTRPSVT